MNGFYLAVHLLPVITARSPLMKRQGRECRNVGLWMQSCVAIAFIKTKPVR